MAVTQALTTSLVGTTMTITLVVTNGGAASTSPVGVYFPNPTGTWSTSATTTGAATGYTAGPTAAAINDTAIVMPASSTVTYVKTGTLSSGTFVGVVPVVTDPGPSGAVSLAYAATVTVNTDLYDVANIAALGGSMTLAASGSPIDGQRLLVRFAQDGTGSRVLSHSSSFAFGTTVLSSGDPSAASSKWEREYRYESVSAKWRCIGLWVGF
jgi:hypothetical protein